MIACWLHKVGSLTSGHKGNCVGQQKAEKQEKLCIKLRRALTFKVKYEIVDDESESFFVTKGNVKNPDFGLQQFGEVEIFPA